MWSTSGGAGKGSRRPVGRVQLGMKESYSIPGCRVERVVRSGSTQTVLVVCTERQGAQCPSCKQHSDAPHSTYVRRPTDLPSAGRAVQLELHVRRFSCRNAKCERRTFAERLPHLLGPSARRTRRLARAQCAVGMTAGAETGARLLKPLAMPTSPDTLLRLMHHTPLPAQTSPQVVGVDDWASRKGRTYGSILVDLKQHRVVDLLPDRSAPTLSAWLRRHPSVEVITRDRSSEYARAAAEGAPQAQQVADRWHLLLNGRQMVERWLTGAHARLRALPEVPSADTAPVRRHVSFPRTRSEARAREESRARRVAMYQAVRHRHLAGEPLLRISHTLRLARGTVRKYAFAPSFPERAARVPGPSILDPYLESLAQRHAKGCENALALWREIRAGASASGEPHEVSWRLRSGRQAPSISAPSSGDGGGPTEGEPLPGRDGGGAEEAEEGAGGVGRAAAQDVRTRRVRLSAVRRQAKGAGGCDGPRWGALDMGAPGTSHAGSEAGPGPGTTPAGVVLNLAQPLSTRPNSPASLLERGRPGQGCAPRGCTVPCTGAARGLFFGSALQVTPHFVRVHAGLVGTDGGRAVSGARSDAGGPHVHLRPVSSRRSPSQA